MRERDDNFQLFEAITTYALDNSSDKQREVLSRNDFNSHRFFEELYVERAQEKLLYDQLKNHSGLFAVIGFPGTGKTTLVNKVLWTMSKEEDVNAIIIDIKQLSDFFLKSDEDFESTIESVLDEAVHQFLSEFEGIDKLKIVNYFLDQNEISANGRFIKHKAGLFPIYSIQKNPDELFSEYLARKVKEDNDRITRAYFELIEAINPYDFLKYLTYRKGIKEQSTTILFIDNLDSITDNETRAIFKKGLRRLHTSMIDYTKVVVTLRHYHMEKLSDQGTFLYHQINLDYSDFRDREIEDKLTQEVSLEKGYLSPEDRHIIHNKATKKGEEKFGAEVFYKRIKYIEACTEDTEDLRFLKDISNLLLEDRRTHETLASLSNFDRRIMLVKLNNFIEFIVYDLQMNLEDLGEDKSSRQFTLESFLYSWLLQNNQLINKDFYNVVKSVKSYKSDSGSKPACDLDHIIISVIYNLAPKVNSRYEYTSTTTIGQVIKLIREIGYSDETVRRRIFEIFKSSKDHGLIELSKYHDITLADDIKDEYQILLTPRGLQMCEYSVYKLVYVLCCMRDEKFTIRHSQAFDYNDKEPITEDTISSVLTFMRHLAQMHYRGLSEIRLRLLKRYKTKWLEYYRSFFCIKTDINRPYDSIGNLQFHNMIESQIKFLERLKKSGNTQYSFVNDRLIREFRNLSQAFGYAVTHLGDGGKDYDDLVRF